MVKSEPVQVIAAVKPPTEIGQGRGDDRRGRWGGAVAVGTSGASRGTAGGEIRALATTWAFAIAVAAAIFVFNVLTRAHDRPDQGVALPTVLEATSFIVNVMAFALPAGAALWMRRRTPSAPRALAGNAAALLAYAGLHIGGFNLLRGLVFPLLFHVAYQPGPLTRELPYELAKDTVTYLVVTAGFWRMLRWPPGRGLASPTAQPLVFDIRDGSRLVRARVGDILAVRSAGNYVEFLLADGRELLMRSPLNAIQAELAPAGFVRTHRSWLVNATRVTGLRPEGSGDYAVELGGAEAPLSRRFPDALARLRAPAA